VWATVQGWSESFVSGGIRSHCDHHRSPGGRQRVWPMRPRDQSQGTRSWSGLERQV